ncbi:MAG: hypothetical protein U5K56_02305 [Halioglobus sp.]|nr:hypothetical protein [Halioglobus sp.]
MIRGETATVEPEIFAKAESSEEARLLDSNAAVAAAQSQPRDDDQREESRIGIMQAQLEERLQLLLAGLSDEYDVSEDRVTQELVGTLSDDQSFKKVAAELGRELYGRLAASLTLAPANETAPDEAIRELFESLQREVADERQSKQECLRQNQLLVQSCADQEQKITDLEKEWAQQVTGLEKNLEQLNEQFLAAQREKQDVLESKSWRYTRFVRYLLAKLQKLFTR